MTRFFAFKSFLIIVSVLGGILIPFFYSNAYDTPFIDKFNSYDLGEIVGQGGWSGATGKWEIIDNDCLEERCVSWINEAYLLKAGENQDSGFWVIYAKIPQTSGVNFEITKADFSTASAIAMIDGNLKGYSAGGYQLIKAAVPIDEWFAISFEWKKISGAERQMRYQYNEEGFTDWFVVFNNPVGGLAFRSNVPVKYDYIASSFACVLGSCRNCEIYDTCIAVGCVWYELENPLIFPSAACVEPYEPNPEECGSFFKCQFCGTEETCGEQLNCEWVNRGLGEKCYMAEPIIPPEQAIWEVPELEDCEELSGVEKWLCKIKNFIAGVFMPSQEKIDSLYQTFANFKQKFPFNYAGALAGFFNDIKISLSEEKSIPIKILGQEANVNFTFWEKTATIGGESETFKNVVKDFTSAIIIFCWFIWIISFIKRIF